MWGYLALVFVLVGSSFFAMDRQEEAEKARVTLVNSKTSLIWENYNLRRFIRSWILLYQASVRLPKNEQPSFGELAAAYYNAMDGWKPENAEDVKLRSFAMQVLDIMRRRRNGSPR